MPRPRTALLLVLAALLAGCTSLPPSRPVDDAKSIAGTWRGRMSGPLGNAPLILTILDDGSYQGLLYVEPKYKEVRGAISVIRPSQTRYEGTDGNGRVTLYEGGGTRVLRFVRDDGGGGAELTPAK
ncbi:MAG TPA: hypothetical protein VET45_00150 [Candidatus Binatia bacterium]|nr:hypothetical protein [Candidatus Binatia bacterium]